MADSGMPLEFGIALTIFVLIFIGAITYMIVQNCCICYNQQQAGNRGGFNGMMNGQQNPVGFGIPPPLQYQQPQLVQAIQSNPSAQVGQQGIQGYTSVQVVPNQVMQSQSPSGHSNVPTGWGATAVGR